MKSLIKYAIVAGSFILMNCDKDEVTKEKPNIIIQARGAVGDEIIELKVNSVKIQSWTLTTSFSAYTAKSDSGAIQIHFVNASGGRSVEIDYLEFDGTTYQAEEQIINTCNGTPGSILDCNGYIQFGGTAPFIQPKASIIDAANNLQIIRGFGAATVFRPTVPLTQAELDLIFGNETGQLGLSILRIRLASDDDPSWRALELSNALGAQARGASVIASPWSPPVRMKTNNNLIGGSLRTDFYDDYATYLNDFAIYMNANGAPLYALSIQNEPDWDASYEGCVWNAQQLLTFLRDEGAKITATRVIAAESLNFNQNMTNPILYDETAAAHVDIIGGHLYGGGLADYPLARSMGKELWMTEHLDTAITWNAVFNTGKEIHECMTIGHYSAYIWWYAKRFYGPLGENNAITKRGYVMSHYSKFVRPGYYRIDATATPRPDIYVSAYKGEKTVIVALNMGNTAIEQQFVINNDIITSLTPYITTQTENIAKAESINVISNIFSTILPAQSITTFVQD